MSSSIKNRVKKIIEDLGVDNFPNIYCVMQDGSRRTWHGMDVIEPFLDGQFKSVKTDDADIAALLNAFSTDTPVELV